MVGEEDDAVSPRSLSLDSHLNSSHEVGLSSILGIEVLNKGMQSIEGALGRPLHAFRQAFDVFKVPVNSTSILFKAGIVLLDCCMQ